MLIMNRDHIESFTFPGGERHIRVKYLEHLTLDRPILIDIKISSSDDLMDVLLLNDVLRRYGKEEIHLNLYYIPYARQDRVMSEDTPNSLKVFTDIINACNFKTVRVLDPHSVVCEHLIKNMVNLQGAVNCAYEKFLTKFCFNRDTILLAPDLGAAKKIDVAGKYLGLDVAYSHKKRDPNTGEVLSVDVMSPHSFKGRNVLVIDDICDGGRTFIELIENSDIKRYAKSISLFVTHGIFSKGVQILRDAGYYKIGCTDSVNGPRPDFVFEIDCWDAFLNIKEIMK